MHSFDQLTVPPGHVGIHWFGQSSFALKDDRGTVLQIDPYFPRERPPERFIQAQSPLDEATLPTDFVLLTHDHGDHTCLESLLRIYEAYADVQFVGPRESVETMVEGGIPASQVTAVTAGDPIELGDMRAHAVWAKPQDGAPADGIAAPDVTHLGYVIEASGKRIYVSGDPINTFAEHDELTVPIAALKPEIGFLTTHPDEGEFPYFDGSAETAQKLGLKVAVPAHYACFVKRTYDPSEWAAEVEARGIETVIIPYDGSIVYPVI